MQPIHISSSRIKTCLPLSILSLLAGGLIYVLARPKNLLLFLVAEHIRLDDTINTMRAHLDFTHWPEWAIYNLPGAFWSLSYILFVDIFASQLSLSLRLLLVGIIPFVGFISEILQYVGILPGTYDTIDAICYAVPFVIYAIITIITHSSEKYEH